jgi:hypothetical protein
MERRPRLSGADRREQHRVLLVGVTVAGVLTGCSSSGAPKGQAQPTGPALPKVSALPSVACPQSLRAVLARGGAAVSAQADVTAGLTTCGYRTAGGAHACTAASVTINTNPQPFKDFQRWVVESAQNDTTARLGDRYFPHEIDGIGVEAAWVPAALDFETATHARWVAVRLTCPSSGQQSLSLAEDLARAGLAAS